MRHKAMKKIDFALPTNKKKIRRFVSCFAANFYLAVISGAMMVQQFQMDKFLVRLDQLDKGTNSRRVVRTLSGDIVDNSISIKSVVSSSSQKRDRVDQTDTVFDTVEYTNSCKRRRGP